MARIQEEAQDAVTKAINRASHAPHTIERHVIYGTGFVDVGDGTRALVIVVPDGKQIHLEMRPELRRRLARELAEEPDEEGTTKLTGETDLLLP